MMKTLAQLFSWSKTIHRLTMFAMIGFSFIMGITGTLMRFAFFATVMPGLDLTLVRFIHGQFSPFFSIILTIMMASGTYMYWFPWYSRRQAQKVAKVPTNTVNSV
jgi:ABC-type Na+ efflux pump permease subunit